MVEKILRFSIFNPWIVLASTFLIALFGFNILTKLPIDAVPDITNNQVQINILSEGLSPEEMEKEITLQLENSLAGIPGLEMTRSLTRNGFAQITAIFEESLDIYFARQQIGERLQEIKEHLPIGTDVSMGPISTGLSEITMWTVKYNEAASDKASYTTPEGVLLKTEKEKAAYLREVQDWIIKPQLKNIKGLAGVDSIGGYVKQYQIEPDLNKLMTLNIGLNELLESVQNSHLSIGPGYIDNGSEAYLVRGDGKLFAKSDIENLIIATRKNVPIHLKDVAAVSIGTEARFGSSTENGHEVVTGTAMMLIDGNSRTLSKAVNTRLLEIAETLPPGIELQVVLNRANLVDRTIKTVATNLFEGALLVIAVLFVFLGNFRAALITSFVIPLSILLTAIGMFEKKISGNLMSLGAIDFGLIVDGAVIITENALRRLSHAQNWLQKRETLFKACQEMLRPSLFGQAIIIIVYIPILMLDGVEGKMFHPMAWTVIFALLSALILSLTFIPAALSLFIVKAPHAEENSIVNFIKKIYEPWLSVSLEKPKKTLVWAASFLFLAFGLYHNIGQEFVPSLDENDIALQAMRIPSTSLDKSTSMQKQVEQALLEIPEVAYVFSKTGTAEMASDPMTPNLSDTFVMLKPAKEWPNPRIKKNDLIEKLEKRLAKVPGNNYEFTQPIQLRFNELIAGSKSDLAIKIYGDDFEKMEASAKEIGSLLNHISGAKDVKVSQATGMPTLNVSMKRDALSRFGLNMKEGLAYIETAIGGGHAGKLFEGDRSFDIVVRLPDELKNNLDYLKNIPVKTNEAFIPLKQIANIDLHDGLNEIKREQGKRFVSVEANVRGLDLGTFVDRVKTAIAKNIAIPKGYWVEYGGQFENLISSKERLKVVVPISFFLIGLLLYSALHSFKNALIVFTGVPLASVGGMLTLWSTGIPFSISAAVGFIALSGIAVLNGLVLLSSIQQRQKQGESLADSIKNGSLERLRPVLMTALVAMLGFIPMAFSQSAGAEVQKPLAIVVIGGLLSSTLLTLLVLPSLYKLFHSEGG